MQIAKIGLTRLNPNNSFCTFRRSAVCWWPLPIINLSILAFFSSMMTKSNLTLLVFNRRNKMGYLWHKNFSWNNCRVFTIFFIWLWFLDFFSHNSFWSKASRALGRPGLRTRWQFRHTLENLQSSCSAS